MLCLRLTSKTCFAAQACGSFERNGLLVTQQHCTLSIQHKVCNPGDQGSLLFAALCSELFVIAVREHVSSCARAILLAISSILMWPASNGRGAVAAFMLYAERTVLLRNGQTVPSKVAAGFCSKTGPGCQTVSRRRNM